MRIDFALTPTQRADARAALQLLDGTDITLEEAARRAVQGRRALRRICFEDAANEFVRSRLSKRARTVEWYENKLEMVRAKFGAQMFDAIDRPAFHSWVRSLAVSEGTRAGIWMPSLPPTPNTRRKSARSARPSMARA